LTKTINIIKPKIIILLGNIACETLLNLSNITTRHGTHHKKDRFDYLLSVHPAWVIRGESEIEQKHGISRKEMLQNIFIQAKQLLKKKKNSFKLSIFKRL
jgi:uracil-DNA glycosylase